MVRLQINVSDKVASQIDKCAREIGISRSAMCAVILHKSIESMDFDKSDAAFIKNDICLTSAEKVE